MEILYEYALAVFGEGVSGLDRSRVSRVSEACEGSSDGPCRYWRGSTRLSLSGILAQGDSVRI